MSIFVPLIILTIYVRFGYRSINSKIFSSSQVRQNLGGPVVAGTCRLYMSSLIYCNQTKYGNKQSLLWNLCVLLTYCLILPGTLDNPVYTEVYTGRNSRKMASSHMKMSSKEILFLQSDSFACLVYSEVHTWRNDRETASSHIENVFYENPIFLIQVILLAG